ncbi:F0F1 ATP synthase subunit A [Roseateles sp.]|uniref:F0F1 ATP synthase subunit A n=1 Tax=Roseateles sp. TaxID=1971397 RepID=UPI003BA672A8
MAAEGHGQEHGPNAGEYIQHHLQHMQMNFKGEMVKQTSIVDFSLFNLDSLIYSVILGLIGCFFLWRAARRATSGVPGRFQAAVEILVEMVENQAKGVIHNATSRKVISPLALTVFVWIFLMNFMDMLPVDLLPALWAKVYGTMGHDPHDAYMRVVPTADLSTTLGLSTSVLIMCFFYSIKIKGMGGWTHELLAAPFGDKWFLYPVNFLMQLIEFAAKTVSHGMRLFGNMFAGELVFMLIALMGGVWAWELNPLSGGFWLGLGHLVAGTVWTLFHILIITLQAFIFMMLTLIYTGQAHDQH